MNAADILLTVLLVSAVAAILIFMNKKKQKGCCCGECGACGKGCGGQHDPEHRGDAV